MRSGTTGGGHTRNRRGQDFQELEVAKEHQVQAPCWVVAQGQPPHAGGRLQYRREGAEPPPTYEVSIRGTTEFHDYETFGDDEHATFSFYDQVNLRDPGLTVRLLRWSKGFGGESASSLISTCAWRTTGRSSRWATSGSSRAPLRAQMRQEDQQAITTVIPAGGSADVNIHLKNDEDDWSTVRDNSSSRRKG